MIDCAGDPLVAHLLDALKKRTKKSKAGANAFSLTNGKPAALAWTQMFSQLWCTVTSFQTSLFISVQCKLD